MQQGTFRALMIGTALSGPAALLTSPASAQTDNPAPSATGAPGAAPNAAHPGQERDTVGLEQVIVTARARPSTKLRTSVSVTSLSAQTIAQSAPASAAEILRNVPGIRAESSGGEGNANIAVRGLPVASGGAKYIQFQEDGLPILEFGDIDFATADTFLRADANIDRVEVVRGGSASTFTSNAPGGVINFIDKTGEKQGGSISTTQGLNFDQHRYDFDYGMPVGDGWRFHLGGFYRYGEGPRTADFRDQDGGQIKANVTKEFDRGFVRIDIKYLDDKSPAYLPVPIQFSGSQKNPHISSLPGFSVTDGTFLSPYFRNDNYYDHNHAPAQADLGLGYHSVDEAIGGELSYDIYDGIKFGDRFRAARIDGDFLGIYPANGGTAQSLADTLGGAGSSLRFASGPATGLPVNASTVGGNGLASQQTLFNTTLNNLNNVTNDAKLSKSLDYGNYGTFDFSLGYYHSTQDIVEDWHWNSYLETVQGKDAVLLNVVNAAGKLVTNNGLIGYNAGFGNVARYYSLRYDTDAPYVSATWQRGPINVDTSFRYDFSTASGNYVGATSALFNTNNPDIPTLPGYLVNSTTAAPVNYTKSYLSYSLGLNYLLDPSTALFVRGSQGGRANAERILFGGGVNQVNGGVPQDVAIDLVQQVEGGVKYRNRFGSLFATGFYAHTQETNSDITNRLQPLIAAVYEAEGLELESSLHYGDFNLALGGTYTHSRITADTINPAYVNHVPQRQADFVWQVTPGYYAENFNFGVNIIGTTDSYASDANDLVMPGFTTVNLFANYFITPAVQLSFQMNNVFDVIGLTEIDSAPNTQGVGTARSIDGRTAKAGLRFTF